MITLGRYKLFIIKMKIWTYETKFIFTPQGAYPEVIFQIQLTHRFINIFKIHYFTLYQKRSLLLWPGYWQRKSLMKLWQLMVAYPDPGIPGIQVGGFSWFSVQVICFIFAKLSHITQVCVFISWTEKSYENTWRVFRLSEVFYILVEFNFILKCTVHPFRYTLNGAWIIAEGKRFFLANGTKVYKFANNLQTISLYGSDCVTNI